jgi:hypothetical protein
MYRKKQYRESLVLSMVSGIHCRDGGEGLGTCILQIKGITIYQVIEEGERERGRRRRLHVPKKARKERVELGEAVLTGQIFP